MWRLLLAGVAVLIVVVVVQLATAGPSRKELLTLTPVGSSFEAVLAECKKKRWRCSQSQTVGFLNQDSQVVVGTSSIWTSVSNAPILFLLASDTEMFWGFDSNGNLLDIWTRRTVDAP